MRLSTTCAYSNGTPFPSRIVATAKLSDWTAQWVQGGTGGRLSQSAGRWLIVACAWVCLNAITTASEDRPEGSSVRVACVGDSITDGYQMPDKEHCAYPAQLGQLLGGGWEVRNFGVSGATFMRHGGYPYQERPAYAAALAWKPDVVVIALGTNDTKEENIATKPDDFVPSARGMIADFRSARPGVKIFLCLPPPAFPAAMGIADDVLQREIIPRIRSIATEENLPLIDLHQSLEGASALFPDKIHPTAEGAARIAEQVYGALLFASQPRAQSTDASLNTAVEPKARLEDDCYNWWTRHAEAIHAAHRINPEVVLIGDSITHFWAGEPRCSNRLNGPRAWAETFGDRRVLNLGFGWDRTQNVLWRLDHGEFEGLHPKLVIVNVGTNNFSETPNARANSPSEVAEGIVAICDRVQRLSPSTHILVMGVLPRGHRTDDGFRAPIRALNAILARTFGGQPSVTYLDIGPRFLSADGSLSPVLMPDGTHPSEKGYSIWGRAIVETGLLP